MGRETECSDQIALLTNDPAANGTIRALQSQRDMDQEHFEAVVDAMRSFALKSG